MQKNAIYFTRHAVSQGILQGGRPSKLLTLIQSMAVTHHRFRHCLYAMMCSTEQAVVEIIPQHFTPKYYAPGPLMLGERVISHHICFTTNYATYSASMACSPSPHLMASNNERPSARGCTQALTCIFYWLCQDQVNDLL